MLLQKAQAEIERSEKNVGLLDVWTIVKSDVCRETGRLREGGGWSDEKSSQGERRIGYSRTTSHEENQGKLQTAAVLFRFGVRLAVAFLHFVDLRFA